MKNSKLLDEKVEGWWLGFEEQFRQSELHGLVNGERMSSAWGRSRQMRTKCHHSCRHRSHENTEVAPNSE